MSDCKKLEPILTQYVDGALASEERGDIDQHLSVCPPCHSRVMAERAVRELIRDRRNELIATRAPLQLRAKCAGTRAHADSRLQVSGFRGSPESGAWSLARRLMPLALAASLVLLVGSAFLYQATATSTRVLAAELTVDHIKCFGMNAVLGTHESTETVESSMLTGFGWRARMPEQFRRIGLELVGSRPCLYGEGRIAHLMYRHEGRPVSIFMLPRVARPEELIEVLGHEAAVWSVGGRTFVLIAREPRAEVQRMASIAQAALR